MKYQIEYYCGHNIRNVVVGKDEKSFKKCDGYGLSEEVEMEVFEPHFPHIPCPKCGLSIPIKHMTWFRTNGLSMICKSRTRTTSTTLHKASGDFVYAWGMFCMAVAEASGLDRLYDWAERKLRKLLGRSKWRK